MGLISETRYTLTRVHRCPGCNNAVIPTKGDKKRLLKYNCETCGCSWEMTSRQAVKKINVQKVIYKPEFYYTR